MKGNALDPVYNGVFKKKQWKSVGYKTLNGNNSPLLVLIPGQIQTYGQEYTIILKPGEKFKHYRDIYSQRASSCTNQLVNILSAELLCEKMVQDKKCQIIRVRTQRIPWRLSDCQNLTIQEGLCILQGVCKGYSQLLQHYPQPFYVFQNMIGMNVHGTIRVWLNQNFALNNLASEQDKLFSISAMKEHIIKLIQQKLINKYFPMRNELLNCPDFYWMSVKIQQILGLLKDNKKMLCKRILDRFLNNPEQFYSSTVSEKISLSAVSTQQKRSQINLDSNKPKILRKKIFLKNSQYVEEPQIMKQNNLKNSNFSEITKSKQSFNKPKFLQNNPLRLWEKDYYNGYQTKNSTYNTSTRNKQDNANQGYRSMSKIQHSKSYNSLMSPFRFNSPSFVERPQQLQRLTSKPLNSFDTNQQRLKTHSFRYYGQQYRQMNHNSNSPNSPFNIMYN